MSQAIHCSVFCVNHPLSLLYLYLLSCPETVEIYQKNECEKTELFSACFPHTIRIYTEDLNLLTTVTNIWEL